MKNLKLILIALVAITLTTSCGIGDDDSDIFGCEKGTGGIVTETLDIIDFNGIELENSNKLIWQTATELNNAYFTLSKSDDGIEFAALTNIEGNGTTNQMSNYDYHDYENINGKKYYKLSSTDFNGNTKEIGVEIINRNDIVAFEFVELFPNPASDKVNINFYAQGDNVNVKLYDAQGKILIDKAIQSEIGMNNINLAINDFANGTYFVAISNADKKYVKMFIKN